MRSRAGSVALLVTLCATCAVLASRYLAARERSAILTREIAGIPKTTPASAVQSAPSTAAAPPAPTPNSVLDARKALLADARAIPELARREAALIEVRRIKAEHHAKPPPPRALPPAYGPKFGRYFTELLGDPEYYTLVREDWTSGSGRSAQERLRRLNLAEVTLRQVLDIEFDQYVTLSDMGGYETAEERQAAAAERSRIIKENTARLQEVLGPDQFAAYTARPKPEPVSTPNPGLTAPAINSMESMVISSPLARRLSYSDAPMTDTDAERLGALIRTMSAQKTYRYDIWYDVEFFNQAQAILNPTQLNALREIQEEHDARALRSQLPKSSELPRTTRRARLEGEE